MNIPNFITVIRILLIPLLVIFLMEGKTGPALLVFMIAGFSDALDGFLARLLKQKTLFGAYVDPIADKLLLDTSFVTLAIMQQLPGWLTVIVVSRDVIILFGICILLLNNRPLDIKPTFSSKMTTFVQLSTICFVMARQYVVDYWFLNVYLIDLTVLFTLLSCLHYIIIGFQILGRPNHNGGRNFK